MTLRLRHIILFTILLLLTACQFEDDQQCPDNNNVGDSYINLTIAISNGDSRNRTREGEMPASGEDGNGREAGFDRENAVTGITLILYQDANGINTASDPILDFVRYFPVTRVESATQGTSYDAGAAHGNHANQIEAKYTTGPQMVGKYGVSRIDFSKTYHAIVIANYDMTSSLTEGTSKLSNVLDATLSTIYSGDNAKAANLFTNFVMSSEEDNTLNFAATGIMTEDASGDKHYDLSDQPLIIERLAARIDFWSKGATYQTKNDGGSGTGTYTSPGYVYTPVKADGTTPSNDRFVLTSITPFNLNAGTEYLLKRSNDATGKYLASETGTNYVIDPATADKTDAEVPTSLQNPLDNIVTAWTASTWTGNSYTHTIASLHELESASSTIDGKENVVICYPMENTLPDESPLYYYATGIAIEGDYYTGDDVTQKEHRIYFGYIRHQGESSAAYDTYLSSELNTDLKTSSSKPMNFGIVRNNIYRIYIDKVHEKTVVEEPKITLKIKVKKWDKFEHAPIYM